MAAIQDFVLRIKTEGINQLNTIRKGVDGLTADLQNLSSVGGPLSNTIGGIVSKLGPLALGATAAAGAFTVLGLRALALADELSDVSDATGITAGALNNFKNSLVDAGGKTEDFSTLALKLNQNLGDAAVGNETAQKAFQKLGVYVRDAGGNIRNTGDVLRDAIGKLAGIEDPAKRAALAVDIFGKTANKLDFTKLNAANDPFKDAQIAQLAKYQTSIDAIAKSINDNLLTVFGKLAIAYTNSMKLADEAEKRANEQGKTRFTDPRTGLTSEAKMTEAQQFRYDLNKKLNEAYKDQGRELDILGKKNKQITLGDFGADSEAKLKAGAESRKRLAASNIESDKNFALKGANEIQAIEINAQAEKQKAWLAIQTQQYLSDAQMAAEYTAKKKEIDTKAAIDVAKVRNQINAKVFSEEEAQRQKIQEELAAEEQRLNKLFEAGRKITEQAAEQNKELAAKAKLVLDSVTMTDRERANAEELFKIEQDRLALLKQIADTYGNEEFAKRTAEEKKINDLLGKRKADAVANQEATAKQQEDFGLGWEKAYRQYVENSKNGFAEAGSLFQSLSRGFEDSIVKFVQTGKLSFKDLFNDLIAQAVRAQSNKLLTSLLGSFGSFFGGGGGQAGAAVLGLPGYANGGNIPAGQLSVVGERGPELFLPKQAGTIIPNGAMGGGTVNNTAVTYSIQAVDASSFRSMLARDPEFIHNVAEQGRRQLPIRSRR
ncbi:COG5281 Phage-related minor tail protein [uncultured Caudovirales phage]|uniref:COG5281 Phage-related minor tail protein n=1 Tax=uncultured Caudovirales phage TaxID=2100421 RepID=A0A6J5LK60_9CAUD|nr:COG5281 Phage-related minor tail protein [uncultured Caudovirales phage]